MGFNFSDETIFDIKTNVTNFFDDLMTTYQNAVIEACEQNVEAYNRWSLFYTQAIRPTALYNTEQWAKEDDENFSGFARMFQAGDKAIENIRQAEQAVVNIAFDSNSRLSKYETNADQTSQKSEAQLEEDIKTHVIDKLNDYIDPCVARCLREDNDLYGRLALLYKRIKVEIVAMIQKRKA